MNVNYYPPHSGGMMPPHMSMNRHPNMPPSQPYMPNPNMLPPDVSYSNRQPLNVLPHNMGNQQNITPTTQQNLGVSSGNACFGELDGIEQVEIRQEASCLDYCVPRCTDNQYKVYYKPGGTGSKDSEKVLYELAEEETSCLEKFCCYKCHSFTMKINNLVSERNTSSVILEGKKKFAAGIMCNFFGCGKPVLPMEVKSPQVFVLGKAAMNWSLCCCSCCSSKIEIRDNGGNVKYTVVGNCCCPVGCYYDNAVTKICGCGYKINQIDEQTQKSQPVGEIKKQSCCCSCRTWCTKAVDYTITFPPQASPEEKMLLIVGAILLDSQSYYL